MSPPLASCMMMATTDEDERQFNIDRHREVDARAREIFSRVEAMMGFATDYFSINPDPGEDLALAIRNAFPMENIDDVIAGFMMNVVNTVESMTYLLPDVAVQAFMNALTMLMAKETGNLIGVKIVGTKA